MINSTNTGLLAAYRLKGDGTGQAVDWLAAQREPQGEGFLWLHFDLTNADSQQWLYQQSGLDETIGDALLAEETRPRTVVFPDGLLVILRGVNMNPGADPEDMVSIRLWIEKDRVISTRRRRLLSVDALKADIASNNGPATPGELLIMLCRHLMSRMSSVITELDERVDTLESEGLDSSRYQLRNELGAIRREMISLRRYLAPQREAMNRLVNDRNTILSEQNREQLRESTDYLIRYIEDLDAMRERASLIQEELVNRMAEHMNQRMYILSLVAGIFLPLGFVTGILGINVGGIPGTEDSHAFEYVLALCLLLVGVGYLIFKRQKWL